MSDSNRGFMWKLVGFGLPVVIGALIFVLWKRSDDRELLDDSDLVRAAVPQFPPNPGSVNPLAELTEIYENAPAYTATEEAALSKLTAGESIGASELSQLLAHPKAQALLRAAGREPTDWLMILDPQSAEPGLPMPVHIGREFKVLNYELAGFIKAGQIDMAVERWRLLSRLSDGLLSADGGMYYLVFASHEAYADLESLSSLLAASSKHQIDRDGLIDSIGQREALWEKAPPGMFAREYVTHRRAIEALLATANGEPMPRSFKPNATLNRLALNYRGIVEAYREPEYSYIDRLPERPGLKENPVLLFFQKNKAGIVILDLMHPSGLDSMVSGRNRILAQCRILRVAFAIHAFEADGGVFTDPGQLVPDYLLKVPVDPVTGDDLKIDVPERRLSFRSEYQDF